MNTHVLDDLRDVIVGGDSPVGHAAPPSSSLLSTNGPTNKHRSPMRSLPRHPPAPSRTRTNVSHPSRRRGGFALLITVVLVAFLVLIVVSLAALTRVETQVAANNRQTDQARRNALFALNLAIGELQKYAGLEQRPNSRWTGVYGSRVTADYDDAPADIAAATTNLTLNGEPARLLVGPGSTRTNLDDSNVPVDYVVAPLVPIEVPASQVPGLDHSGNDVAIGRYAWWVGDEGVKARVNLPRFAASDPVELERALVTAARRVAGPRPARAPHPRPHAARRNNRFSISRPPRPPVTKKQIQSPPSS